MNINHKNYLYWKATEDWRSEDLSRISVEDQIWEIANWLSSIMKKCGELKALCLDQLIGLYDMAFW